MLAMNEDKDFKERVLEEGRKIEKAAVEAEKEILAAVEKKL